MTGPIFVGGAERSGKTLVRWMLSSHPRIVVTRRTGMWTLFYGRFGDLDDAANLDRCLAAMVARRQVAELEPDVAGLRAAFASGPRTYGRLFALMHERYAARIGKARWGDQTPFLERRADVIFAELPESRFLHLVRDPRDRFAALLDKRGARRPGDVGAATATWVGTAALARRGAERYPGRYMVVRYESLVEHPDRTARQICDFLEEAFDPRMLRLDGVSRYDQERAASPEGSPISRSYVGRYRSTLGRSDVAFIQSVARREMTELGYEPETLRLTAADRIRYAAGWPVSYARMRSSA